MSCSVSRKATKTTQRQVERAATSDVHDTVNIECHDTLREVTTVTVRLNAEGDTLRVSTVTDRTAKRDRVERRLQRTELRMDNDTVVVNLERDAVVAASPNVGIDKDGNLTPQRDSLKDILKWMVALIIAITVLIITVKTRMRKASS